MKQVISNNELKRVMINAIDLLCNTVADTLGPSGNNVIIDEKLAPYITNDGVTIANEISSDDERINCVLEIAKEAALKTNEQVGDGTTTTLVLLQSIFKEGLKAIDSGYSAIKLREDFYDELKNIEEIIDKIKKVPNNKDLKNIATISSGSKKDGDFIFEVFSKVESKNSIILEESKTSITYFEEKKGYGLEIDEIPSLYFDNEDEITLNNVHIMVLNGYLDDLESISDIINEACQREKNMVIFANDYSEDVKNNLMVYQLQKKNIYLFKLPDYASRKEAIEKDIISLANGVIKNIDYEAITFNDLGVIDKIIINKKEVVLLSSNDTSKQISKIEKELKKSNDDYEKEFLQNRLAKFKNGIVTIYVGGNTKAETKERVMRFEDALCALDVARYGIVPGEGISFLIINNYLGNSFCDEILKIAFETPFKKIIENMGMDYKIVRNNISKNDYKTIYNHSDKTYEQIKDSFIIDPALVIKTAIKNAISIASMLLTTNYLVVNNEI